MNAACPIVLCLTLASCVVGSRAAEQAVRNPRGAIGDLVVEDRGTVRVELLEVQDTALLVFTIGGGRLAVAPFRAIRGGRIEGVDSVGTGMAPSTRQRERLHLVSRFPYGIPAPALARLLAEAGQQAPDNLAPSPDR